MFVNIIAIIFTNIDYICKMKKEKEQTLIGIDAGSTSSGIIVIVGNEIREGYNMSNDMIMGFITQEQSKCSNIKVIIEDVRPYNMRITNGIIETIKFIGQIEWRIRNILDIQVELIPRWNVKQWVFLQFKTRVVPKIEQKIDAKIKKRDKKGLENKYRDKVTFVWVDDRMIEHAMRKHWKIPRVGKVGQITPYNLREHSWQALALVSYYMALK